MRSNNGKLIVENFGPIKHAEVDLRQVLILIGPQGAGKSTLLKLIAAIQRILRDGDRTSFDTLCYNYYEVPNFSLAKAIVEFDAYNCHGEYRNGELTINRKRPSSKVPLDIFIPSERNFFATVDRKIFKLSKNEIRLPNLLYEFGELWKKASEAKPGYEITFLKDIRYSNIGGFILYGARGSSVLLQQSASGMQSSVPMYIVIEYFSSIEASATFQSPISVFVEEPELNLFPDAQKKLVEYMANRLIHHHQKPHSLYIATHSPYILTAFDNLIQANNAFENHPDLKKKIDKIIPQECWIDFDEVSAYYLEDGKTKSILNRKNRAIAANKLDKVSEEIAIEFDKLLDITYQPA